MLIRIKTKTKINSFVVDVNFQISDSTLKVVDAYSIIYLNSCLYLLQIYLKKEKTQKQSNYFQIVVQNMVIDFIIIICVSDYIKIITTVETLQATLHQLSN